MADVALVFCFEDFVKNIYSGRYESDVEIWHDIAREWGCTHFIMIDTTIDQVGKYYVYNDQAMIYERYFSYDELEAAHPTWTFIYTDHEPDLKIRGVTPVMLKDFVHPTTDCCYVLGDDSATIDLVTNRKNKIWISVESILSAWSLSIASIVLYDRYVKSLPR